jgi:hypothetical protein
MLQLFLGCRFFFSQSLLLLLLMLQLLMQLTAKALSSLCTLGSTISHVGCKHNLRSSSLTRAHRHIHYGHIKN